MPAAHRTESAMIRPLEIVIESHESCLWTLVSNPLVCRSGGGRRVSVDFVWPQAWFAGRWAPTSSILLDQGD